MPAAGGVPDSTRVLASKASHSGCASAATARSPVVVATATAATEYVSRSLVIEPSGWTSTKASAATSCANGLRASTWTLGIGSCLSTGASFGRLGSAQRMSPSAPSVQTTEWTAPTGVRVSITPGVHASA